MACLFSFQVSQEELNSPEEKVKFKISLSFLSASTLYRYKGVVFKIE